MSAHPNESRHSRRVARLHRRIAFRKLDLSGRKVLIHLDFPRHSRLWQIVATETYPHPLVIEYYPDKCLILADVADDGRTWEEHLVALLERFTYQITAHVAIQFFDNGQDVTPKE